MRWLRRLTVAGLALAVLGALTAALVFWMQGYRVYVLHTGSMEPTYPVGSIVVDRPARDGYHVGEVITFARAELGEKVVTHRVAAIASDGKITTKGDANRTTDVGTVSPSQVQGSVVFGAKDVGYVVEFFRHPAGLAALAMAIASFALLWGLFFPDEPDPAGTEATMPDGGGGPDDLAQSSGRHRTPGATLATAAAP